MVKTYTMCGVLGMSSGRVPPLLYTLHSFSPNSPSFLRTKERRRREGGEKEERRGDLLLRTRVLRVITNVLLLFTRVFKWHPLKPMHFQGGYVIQMLKPTHRATKKEEKDSAKCQKPLKPMRLCKKDERKEHNTEHFDPSSREEAQR